MKKLFLILAVILLTLFIIKQKNMTWRQSFLKAVYPLIMLPGKLFPNKKSIQLNKQHIQPLLSFYDLESNCQQ